MKPSVRFANLDFYRFLAIAMVIYYHIGERFTLDKTVAIGKYGVELFFILSGFLISNIYYRKTEGTNLVIFWLQRFLRTYPPYLVALLISYSAVFFGKGLKFDPGFLFFFQNFYPIIPFFKISWSLCIEEHFYAIFPLIILLMGRIANGRHSGLMMWILITLTPTLIRYLIGNYEMKEFGYFTTATIFRFDGIALGCTMGYVINHYQFSIKSNLFVSLLLTILFGGISYWLADMDSVFKYCSGYLALVLSAGMMLVSFYYAPDFIMSKNIFVRRTAAMAYSLYLTHALILNVFDKLFHKFPPHYLYVTVPACVLVMLVVGFVYHKAVEQPSIALRDNVLHYRTWFRKTSG